MAAKRYAIARPTKRRGPSPALKKAQAALVKARSRSRSLAQKVQGSSGNLKTGGIVVAGGALSGVLEAFVPDIAGIDARLIAGVAAVAAGTFLIKGKMAGPISLMGAGMLAAAASEEVANMLSDTQSTAVAAS